MNPRALNLDSDPYLEMFLTLNDGFGGPCQAVVIDYAPSIGFYLRQTLPVPFATGGPAAIGDLDLDGKTEFVTGAHEGYLLFEWSNDSLRYVGLIDSTWSNNNAATLCHPKPDMAPYVLIGHSDNLIGSRYELLASIADNQFEIVDTIVRPAPPSAGSISAAGDVDCDGIDELVMQLWPSYKEYKWDGSLQAFVERCSWGALDSLDGALNELYAVDFDRNGSPEWTAISGAQSLYAFVSPECVNCDTSGHCAVTPSCVCDCHGDPHCDGTRCDITDVITAINVAFRGALGIVDNDCPIQRADFDCNSMTDVIDVVKVIDVAFRGADASSEICNPCSP
jgi:hypothetical protein